MVYILILRTAWECIPFFTLKNNWLCKNVVLRWVCNTLPPSFHIWYHWTNHKQIQMDCFRCGFNINVYHGHRPIMFYNMRKIIFPFCWGFYVRQAIKTAARDLVLHGIVSQSNPPSIINNQFYDCCSNINCRLSRSKKASNINFTWILTDFP